MKFTSQEFVENVQNNAKADLIPKGTEFKVYNKNNTYICTLVVHKTIITYLEIVSTLPNDMLIDGYTFVATEE